MPLSGPTNNANQILFTAPGSGRSLSVQSKLGQIINVLDYGGAGDYSGGGAGTGTDNLAALVKIFTQFGANAVVKFPCVAGKQYRFSNVASFANFGDLVFDADDGAIFYFDTYAGLPSGLRSFRPITGVALDLHYNFVIGDRGQKHEVDKALYLSDANFDRSVISSVLMNTTEVLPLKTLWSGGDGSFNVDSVYTTPDAKTILFSNSPTDSNFHVGMRPAAMGDEHTAHFETAIGTPTLAVMVRASGGYAGVFFDTNVGTSGVTGFRKDGSNVGVSTTVTYIGQGTHASYSAYLSHITIRPTGYNAVSGVSTFDILFSGSIVQQGSVLGVIYQVGFGLFGTVGNGVTIKNWTVARNKEPAGAKLVYPLIIGDSRAESHSDCWAQYLRETLEGTAGIRVVGMANYAISGQTSTQQKANLLAKGVPGATGGPAAPILPTVCIIDAFTNNIQGSFAVSTMLTDYAAMIAFIAAAAPNCQFILCNTYLWYTQAQNGGIGQGSGQYSAGAPHRTALMRFCSDNGYQLLDWNEIMGPIVSNFDNGFPGQGFTPDLRPNLPPVQDNIHPPSFINRLLGWAAARCVAGLMFQKSTLATPWINIAAGAYQNSWTQNVTQPLRYRVDSGGLVHFNGVLNIGTVTDNTVVLQLPGHLVPDQLVIRQLLAFDAGGTARLEISKADGTLRIFNKSAAGASFLFMDGFAPYKMNNGAL